MNIHYLVIGVLLLLLGRRLFWLFVGLAGFLFGLEAAQLAFIDQPHWLQLTIAIALGCFGALVAVVAQRLAFVVAGFFVGVFLGLRLGHYFALSQHGHLLLITVVGLGVIGALLALTVMDRAIILLACLLGAGAVVGELSLAPLPAFAVFFVLALSGYLFQARMMRAAEAKKLPPGE